MKVRTLKILLIIQFVVIVLILMWIFGDVKDGNNETELLREISPDGNYVLLIEKLGNPGFFAVDRIKVKMYENNTQEHYGVTFRVDISTGGGSAKYEIEWLEYGVQIILSGARSEYYILPFKTLEDSKRPIQ